MKTTNGSKKVADKYVLEKGLPIPTVLGTTKYPLRQMKVGDSFAADPSRRVSIGNSARHIGIKVTVPQATRRLYSRMENRMTSLSRALQFLAAAVRHAAHACARTVAMVTAAIARLQALMALPISAGR